MHAPNTTTQRESLIARLLSHFQSKSTAESPAEKEERKERGRPPTPTHVLWSGLLYPYLTYTHHSHLPKEFGSKEKYSRFRKSLQKEGTWHEKALSASTSLETSGISLPEEQKEAFLQGRRPIVTSREKMVRGKLLNKDCPPSPAEIRVQREQQAKFFKDHLPETVEHLRVQFSREGYFCLLSPTFKAEPGTDDQVAEVDRWGRNIQSILKEIRARFPTQKNKDRKRREEKVLAYLQLLQSFFHHRIFPPRADGKPRMGRPPYDRWEVLRLIVTYKILRGGTWEELDEEIRLRNELGRKAPSLSTCKRFWYFLNEHPEVLQQLILYCLYALKKIGALNSTICLVDGTDFSSQGYRHEGVGWSYKKRGWGMRLIGVTTADKVLLGYILVNPETGEVQNLLPTFRELPDPIQEEIKHIVGDKAYDSTAHRTEFNKMGKILHADNKSKAKQSKLTPMEAAINRLIQIVRPGVENVFCELKKNRIFDRFREKTSPSVRTALSLTHLMHLLGTLYKRGVRSLEGCGKPFGDQVA